MFRSTRIKLTAWYLLIIMFISISFSLAVFNIIASELDRVERMQRIRIEHSLPGIFDPTDPRGFPTVIIEPDIVEEAKNRLIMILGGINTVIFITSGFAGYFLAGRTLRPIKEMMDEQNRFITDASHELLTPLTSLKSEIEVNLRDKNLTVKQTRDLLESNLEEVNNLQVLSDGLIKLTQYQKDDERMIFSQNSLVEVGDEAVKKVLKLAKKKNIKINNSINNYQIEGNKQNLIELLVIFLDNSIKYSAKETNITLSSEKNDSTVQLVVKDQGIGIDDQDLPHLFDRFYRADKSRTKSKVAGYGIGLSIAKEIVDRHNGSIKVKSVKSKGTSFIVEFPVKQKSSKLI